MPDRIEEFLRAGLIAHVSCIEDGEPRVIPFLYHYEGGHVYIHGSPGSSTLRLLRDGRSVAIAVTQIVDLIASKTAPDHSANYRSVVIYGRGRQIGDTAKKRRILDAMTERYFPGRRTKPARLRRFAATHFGPYAGYAQQYLIHYIRTSPMVSGYSETTPKDEDSP